jgi:CSLREA domain-containing protein
VGDFSLREALDLSNNNLGAIDTIEFSPALTGGTIVLTLGELPITDSVSITGLGANLLTVDASGNDPTPFFDNGDGSRVFDISSSATVLISGLTITGGDVSGPGGGILNSGNLTLTDSVVSGNAAPTFFFGGGGGGGIYSNFNSSLTVTGGAISNNSAGYRGGGICARYSVLNISGTLITGNSVIGDGGGIWCNSVNVTNSTISGNSATGGGGGIRSLGFGPIQVTGSTISYNSASSGGGIFGNYIDVSDSTVSGNSANQGFGGGIRSDNVTVTNSTIIFNASRYGGGGIYGSGITVTGSTISGNSTLGSGGGIFSRAYGLTIAQTEISNNSASGNGGGVYSHNSNLAITDSTISGNSTNGSGRSGGGIWFSTRYDELATISNSTIDGNSTDFAGGGIYAYGAGAGATAISHTTITGNSARFGGGIFVALGALQLDDSIVATNFASNPLSMGRDITGIVGFVLNAHYNLIGYGVGSGLAEASVGSPDANGNLVGGSVHGSIDPLLGPLADNGGTPLATGGHVLTRVLLGFSPAIDAGNPAEIAGAAGVPEFDERGAPFTRVADGDGDSIARIDIGAIEIRSLSFVVDTLVDEDDGDYSVGDFSLREAIDLANSSVGGMDKISFSPALAHGTIVLTQGELIISDAVKIVGLGSNLLTINASGNDPTPGLALGDGSGVFDVFGGAAVEISGLTISGGDTYYGGGVYNSGNLTLINSTVSGNAALFAGGGIYSNFSGTLNVKHSNVTNNTAKYSAGGGIFGININVTDSSIASNTTQYNNGGGIAGGYASSVTVTGSTISGNKASQNGGGIWSAGNLVVTSSSISNNTSNTSTGGGIWSSGPTVIANSSISNNSAQVNGGGIFGSNNLSVTGSTISNNLARGNGGGIQGYNNINVSGSTISGNTANGNGGGLYLRPSYFNASAAVSNSTISGNTASLRGGGMDVRAFNSAQFSVTGSTFSANIAGDSGGGLYGSAFFYSNGTIANSTFSANRSQGSSAFGGGLDLVAKYGSAMTVRATTISGNMSANLGGGLATLVDYNGRITVADSTISGNTASRFGGGGHFSTFSGTMTVTNSTVSGNTASADAAGLNLSTRTLGTVLIQDSTVVFNHLTVNGGPSVSAGIEAFTLGAAIRNSIVAQNTDRLNQFYDLGAPGSPSLLVVANSLIGFTRLGVLPETPVGVTDAHGNLVGGSIHGAIDPLLGPLVNNGGPTLTHAPLAGSPAIDRGDPTAVAGSGAIPSFDQRGAPVSRVYDGDGVGGARLDMGAVEYQPIPAAFFGDFDHNGVVDSSDYTYWADRRGQIVAKWTGADGNGNGIIDAGDLDMWKLHFGITVPSPGGGAGAAAAKLASVSTATVVAPRTVSSSPAVSSAASSNALRGAMLASPASSQLAHGTVDVVSLARSAALDFDRHDAALLALLNASAGQGLKPADDGLYAPSDVGSGSAESSDCADAVFELVGSGAGVGRSWSAN